MRAFLVALSEVPAIKAGGPSDCVPYFTNLKAKLPQFASIVLLDEVIMPDDAGKYELTLPAYAYRWLRVGTHDSTEQRTHKPET